MGLHNIMARIDERLEKMEDKLPAQPCTDDRCPRAPIVEPPALPKPPESLGSGRAPEPPAPPIPLIEMGELRTCVEGLEKIMLDARIEIQKELGEMKSTAPNGDGSLSPKVTADKGALPPPCKPELPGMLGTTSPRSPDPIASASSFVWSSSELEDLRARATGLLEAVIRLSELRKVEDNLRSGAGKSGSMSAWALLEH